jgi:hypothetical protein
MTRSVRRILLVLISLAIGYGLTLFIVTVLLGTTVPEFWVGPEQPVQIPYFILVGFFLALAAGIWLDKLLKTEILPE